MNEDFEKAFERRVWNKTVLDIPDQLLFKFSGQSSAVSQEVDSRQKARQNALSLFIANATKEQAGAAAAGSEKLQTNYHVQELHQFLTALVANFVKTYPGDANALYNESIVTAFNHLPIGADMTAYTLEKHLGETFADEVAKEKLLAAWRNENMFMMFRQLEARSLEGSILNHVSVFKPLDASPFTEYDDQAHASERLMLHKKLLSAMLRSEQTIDLASTSGREQFSQGQADRIISSAEARTGLAAGAKELIWNDKLIEASELIASLPQYEQTFQRLLKEPVAETCLKQGNGKQCLTDQALDDLQKITARLSLLRFLLDAIDQLRQSRSEAMCDANAGGLLCADLPASYQKHREATAKAKKLCQAIQSTVQDNETTCYDMPVFTAFEWIHSVCTSDVAYRQIKGFQDCLAFINDNLPVAADVGHWPTVGSGRISRATLEKELSRVKSFELQLQPAEARIVTRMEELLRQNQ